MGLQGQRRIHVPTRARAIGFGVALLALLSVLGGVSASSASASIVAAWGLNDDGQLGNGSTTGPEKCLFNKVEHACAVTAGLVSGLSEVSAVAAGKLHSLALLSGGTVEAWGRNSSGQLGNGTTTGSALPVAVSGLSGVTAVAAGTSHSLALLSNGTVEAWGSNEYGQLGNGSSTGPEKCFVKQAATEVERGCSLTPVPVSGLSGAIAISAGDGYSLALLSNGTVKAWGNNEAAQLGTGSATGPEQCKVNEVFKVVVEEEGKKVEKEEVKAVEHDCSVTPVAVSALSGVTAISAGFAHNLALLETGEVKAWGYNSFGQLGNGSTTGPSKCTFGLNQVACATKPVAVSGLTGASAVAAGEQHSLAAKAGGGVVAWGSNEEGQLGDGTLNESDVPVAVTGLGQVSAVAAGTRTSMALLPSGAVMAWGSNYYGQVGDGTRTERLRPTMVCGLTGGSSIATRGGHSLAAITGTPACPAVTSISPTTGSGQGGTSVTITGSTLAEATEVHFGNSKATSFTVESATKIVAVSPPGSGVVHVTVTTPLGQSAPSAADLFTYQAPPNVTRVQPNTGPSAGGTPVTISGSAFNGASEVKFGATPAASFTVESANTIKAISPAHAAGTVDVTVKTQFGTSTSTAEDQFAFVQLEAPEFGRCLKVAVGTGAYATSNCTTTGGERKFEWNPGSGPHPLVKKKFTTSIKPTTLAKLTTTGAGEVMTCTGQTGHGEYTGARSVGGVGMTFTGCHRGELGKCQSPLAAEGEVATTTLQGELGVVTTSPEGPTKNKIGLDLKPASGETVAEFSCAGVPALVTGSVIVEIKANSMLSKVTLKYVGAKGVQKPSRFEGGEQDVLHTTLGEASPEGSVLTLATVQTNEEKVEINSVV